MVEQGIRIDKSAHRRVIIPAIEVIESRLLIVDISTIAQRVDVCQGAHSGDDFTIGIVVIACNNRAAGVYDVHYVTLEVGDVIVHRTIVLHGIGQAAGIVEEVNGIGSPGHAHQLTTGIVVAVSNAVHSLAGSQAAGIVGKTQAVASVGSGCKATAVGPGEVPPGTIEVAGGIAYGGVDNRLPVKTGEQILPVGITVGVGVAVGGSAIGGGQNIAYRVIGIGVAFSGEYPPGTRTGLCAHLIELLHCSARTCVNILKKVFHQFSCPFLRNVLHRRIHTHRPFRSLNPTRTLFVCYVKHPFYFLFDTLASFAFRLYFHCVFDDLFYN